MSESADYIAGLPQSPHSAERLLHLLIELIAKTTDVGELTDDVIEASFEIKLDPFQADKKEHAARLTSEWNVALVVTDDESAGRMIELGFFDSNEETVAPLTEICGVDSSNFGTALVDAGYQERPIHGVHGEPSGKEYSRGPVRVVTQTRGEARQPPDKTSHECITSVWIQRE